jgi:hypothetical protein
VIGRAEHAQLVKQALIRDGISPNAIVVTAEPARPIARINDGIASPDDRKVDIRF